VADECIMPATFLRLITSFPNQFSEIKKWMNRI